MKRFLNWLFPVRRRIEVDRAPDRLAVVRNWRPFAAGRYVTSGPLFARPGKL